MKNVPLFGRRTILRLVSVFEVLPVKLDSLGLKIKKTGLFTFNYEINSIPSKKTSFSAQLSTV